MEYYIEISSWNLLESFVTESISPFSFYEERNFGNNLSRYMSGEKEKSNFLILSSEDLGGDFSLVVDEALLEINCLNPIPGMKKAFTYPRTIYYRKGLVRFRVSSVQLKEALIAESRILLEVKCLDKYTPYFYIKSKKNIHRPTISKLKESFSFDKQSYIDFDNRFNKLKGALVGYVRGMYTTADGTNLLLQNELRDLKNTFGGLNTQIMMSDIFDCNPDVAEKILKCKKHYFDNIGETNSFDVLVAQYNEIIRIASLRSKEKDLLNRRNRTKELLEEKTYIEKQISQIEQSYNIVDIRRELADIKAREKGNGKSIGKSRQYFKKGTTEFERKKELKDIIQEFENGNTEYRQLNSRLYSIEQELNDDSDKYDSILSALFIRISDILNDLAKSASCLTNKEIVDLSMIEVSETIQLISDNNNPEVRYFNVLLKCILNSTTTRQLSEHYVLQVLEESAKIFKNDYLSETDGGRKIMNSLREYWAYKNQRIDQFAIPDDMPIFQSIMSFFVKPLGFDQIERYMMIKKYSHKAYAFTLWGAWVGFADMPKTFTNVIYQNDDVTLMIENKLIKC